MNHIYLSTVEDVPELRTGIEDGYPGSTSPYAPEVDNLVALRQVDPAHNGRDTSQYELNGVLFLCIRFT